MSIFRVRLVFLNLLERIVNTILEIVILIDQKVTLLMEIDNTRDRFKYGYDAGLLVDGKVVEKDGHIYVDPGDGTLLCVEDHLKTLLGKEVRLTVISTDAMELMSNLLAPSTEA